MEPKFQTSFIPKNPISTTSSRTALSTSFSLLSTIGTILFILAIMVSGGLFGYEQLLKSQIADTSKSLDLAKSEFDPATLNQLIIAGSQIQSAKKLLANHTSVSSMFALLQANVLPQVSFSTFDFQNLPDGTVRVSVSGESASYGALRQQSQIFNTITAIKNPSFSDIDLSPKGTVSMKFQADFDPNVISYQREIDNLPANSGSKSSAPAVNQFPNPSINTANQ